ncbi:MAG: hypothetical protein ACKPDI_03800 [Actinomycetota bacterium]
MATDRLRRVWRAIGPSIAVLAIAGGLWWGHRSGGLGLAITAVAAGAALFAAHHQDTIGGVGLLAAVVLWNLASMLVQAVPDNGDRFASRVATWGRDHGYGPVIDRLEAWAYRTPPSKDPAQDLGLGDVPTLPPSTTSPGTTSPGTTSPSTTAPTGSTTVTSSTAAPTTIALPAAPPALQPAFSPALPGEGQWVAVAAAGGQEAMWATSLRPLPDTGGVVATMVVIDQTHLRAGLFNGSELPGGRWQRSNFVPKVLRPALVAAMNGGFRFDHMLGGFKTEGVEVKPLRDGDATLAVARDGRLVLGRLGRDLVDDGSWLSLRQNLMLMVDGGTSQVQQAISEGVWWGADKGNAVYVKRSGVCELADGRLAYVIADPVDANQFARSMIAMGCQKAIQMDINVDWPLFTTFTHDTGAPVPHFVDRRMTGNPRRSLDGSSKDFFAFFDATLVPAGSVLDA